MRNVSSKLLKILLAGCLVALFGAGAVTAQVKAYVANNGSNSLSVIDVATNTVVGTIPVAGGPDMLIISPDNSRAYVTTDAGTTAVVDLTTNTVIASVPVGRGPTFLTQSLDGGFVYVSNFSGGSVSVIDTATLTVTTTLPLASRPANGIATTRDGASVWVGDGNGVISVIDTATNTITQPTFSTPGGFRPFGIVFTPDGALAYLANGTTAGAVVLDAVTHATVATIPVTGIAFSSAITPDGSTVYQTSTSGTVSMIDTATNTVVASLSLGGSLGVDVTPDGAFGYVANVSNNTVAVINTATRAVVATIPVGDVPFGVAITHSQAPPDDDHDGVPNNDDNCPQVANPDQADFDHDGIGDACDADVDGDGVLNGSDQCAFTPAGATVDGTGCSIAQLCPCAGPWKNHGKYVSCVAHAAESFLNAGLITQAQKDATVSAAGRSSCGK